MNRIPFMKGLTCLAICLLCLSYGGCTGEAQTAENNTPANEGTSQADGKPAPTPDPVADAKKAAQADLPFTVQIKPGSALVGQGSQAVIKAIPAAGFKMNVEFPSSFVPNAHASAQFSKNKLSVSDAKVTEEAIEFTPAYTVGKTGPAQLTGKISISVCNEKICKLYRNHPIAWAVDAK